MNYFVPTPNLKYKTTICQSWKGQCFRNEYCIFAHGQKDLRTIEQVTNFNFLFDFQVFIQNNQRMKQQKVYYQTYYFPNIELTDNSKTIKCKFYSKGNCKRGQNCTFIHNKQEFKKNSSQIFNNEAPSIQTNTSEGQQQCLSPGQYQQIRNKQEPNFF